MTVRAWLNSEMDCANPILTVGVGALLLIGGMIVRIRSESPYRTILEMGIGDIVPPVWLMTLLWSLSLFLIGCAAGFVLGYRRGGCEIEKYKGCMIFVILAILELSWYRIFFVSNLIFISVLVALLILSLGIWVTSLFYRVTKFAGMLLLLHDIWLICMTVLNAVVLFRA